MPFDLNSYLHSVYCLSYSVKFCLFIVCFGLLISIQVDKMTTEMTEMRELKKKRMTMTEMHVNLAGKIENRVVE